MKQDSLHVAFAQLLREFLPTELEEFHRGETDLGQTSMWLVGLASTLLVLAVADPERVRAVLGDRYQAVAILLMFTIGGGVCYSIFRVWLAKEVSKLMRRLLGHVAGYTAAMTLERPPDLSDGWDEAEIVRRLGVHFELDYTFLLTYRVPLAGCQDSYLGQYEIWKKHEQTGFDYLKKVMAAHLGLTRAETDRLFQATDEGQLAKIRRRALMARSGWYVASVLFTVSAVAFLVAMFYVARGLWSMP